MKNDFVEFDKFLSERIPEGEWVRKVDLLDVIKVLFSRIEELEYKVAELQGESVNDESAHIFGE